MNVYEYATAHSITTAKANRLARTGKVTARRIDFGVLAYWDIIETGETFEPINVTITNKSVGGGWVLTAHQDDNGFTITSHNKHHRGIGSELRFTTADDAHHEYASHTFDRTRPADSDPLAG